MRLTLLFSFLPLLSTTLSAPLAEAEPAADAIACVRSGSPGEDFVCKRVAAVNAIYRPTSTHVKRDPEATPNPTIVSDPHKNNKRSAHPNPEAHTDIICGRDPATNAIPCKHAPYVAREAEAATNAISNHPVKTASKRSARPEPEAEAATNAISTPPHKVYAKRNPEPEPLALAEADPAMNAVSCNSRAPVAERDAEADPAVNAVCRVAQRDAEANAINCVRDAEAEGGFWCEGRKI